MVRLLLLAALVLLLVALAAWTMNALTQAVEGGARLGRNSIRSLGTGLDGGKSMQKIAFVALILLLVGLTSGLIGGL